MDAFENNIKNKMSDFDTLHPANGHEKRFLIKLQRQQQHAFTRRVGRIAASIAVILALGVVSIQPHLFQQDNTISELTLEQQEAEWFYENEYENKLNELMLLLDKFKDQKQIIIAEIHHMEAMYVVMKKEIQKNPNDPRALNALINHYQTKIAFIEQINEQLSSIENNTLKNRAYENGNT